ncbi:MAG: hypothetical protein ACYCWW_20560, partial [Deltaproteobacteria bacterium]
MSRSALGIAASFVTACAGPKVAVSARSAEGYVDHQGAVRRVLPTSVRIHVLTGGKLVRTASAVCLRGNGGKSFVITNQHVVQRGELTGDLQFELLVDGPRGTSQTFPA